MITYSDTYYAIPPGETIKELMEDREMSKRQFAELTHLAPSSIDGLLEGDIVLTPQVADILTKVLGMPSDFWTGLESGYREKLKLVEEENSRTKIIRPFFGKAKEM